VKVGGLLRIYDSQDWWYLKGRGWVAMTNNDRECEDYSHLMEEEVLIDGHLCTVKGVESHLTCSQRVGAHIGLLVTM